MTTTDSTQDFPCIRGCTFEPIGDEPAKPKPAKHGLLCASCYYRVKHALRETPDLMENIRRRIQPPEGADFIPFGSHAKPPGSPAPLRVEALDASDALFAKLVSWIDALAGDLHAAVPSIRTWMGYAEVQGSRPVSPIAAHDLASQLTSWFLVRLDTIAASSSAVAFHDDICWGWEDSPGVYKLTGQYGVEPRPLRDADKRECPVCGRKEVFVKWPDRFNSDMAVMCGRCKWVAEPEKYGHYAELFKRA